MRHLFNNRGATVLLISVSLHFLLVKAEGKEQLPQPCRIRNISEGGKLFFTFTGQVDKECIISIKNDNVKITNGKGEHNLIPLPERNVYIYVESIQGRGTPLVWQDPEESNGYEAVISLRTGKNARCNYGIKAYYTFRAPTEPEFLDLFDLPELPKEGTTLDVKLWGERSGEIHSLITDEAEFAFEWSGQVEHYAVLAFDGKTLSLLDCGYENAQTLTHKIGYPTLDLVGTYLVLSACSGSGRVRVIQRMNIKGFEQALIEINDKDIEGTSKYKLTAYLVPQSRVEQLYKPEKVLSDRWQQARQMEQAGDMKAAAAHWSWIASHTQDKMTRIWAVEKFCMLEPYPGSKPNVKESKLLADFQREESEYRKINTNGMLTKPNGEPLEVLFGKNMIIAWPKEILTKMPTKWHYLAQADIMIDWLEIWTQNKPRNSFGRRLLIRFRADEEKFSFYSGYSIIRRRDWNDVPVIPCPHEISHGFIWGYKKLFIGYLGEGFVEFMKNSCQYFLDRNDNCTAFRHKRMLSFKRFMYHGRDINDIDGYDRYEIPAGFYFVLMQQLTNGTDEDPDFYGFGKLLRLSHDCIIRFDEQTSKEVRWQLFVTMYEEAFGPKAREVLCKLRVPITDSMVIYCMPCKEFPEPIHLDGKSAVLSVEGDRSFSVGNMAEGAAVQTDDESLSFVGVPSFLNGLEYTYYEFDKPASLICKVKEPGQMYLCVFDKLIPSYNKLGVDWKYAGVLQHSVAQGRTAWRIYQAEVRPGQVMTFLPPNRRGAILMAKEINLE